VTGSRGSGWVVAQFLLIGVIVAVGRVGPGWPGRSGMNVLFVIGAVLVALGSATALLAALALGRALTPFPRPASRGRLVERGPYRLVRHPIYFAGALFFTGFSLMSSPIALALTMVLIVLWGKKALFEERLLRARYSQYEEYARRVRFRLVPGVW
jgi:protein-S-isoprenylcysteine O-methyltransferase Ste14